MSVLANWQTYAAGLLFVTLCAGPMILISMIGQKPGHGMGSRVLLSILALPCIQAFALVVFVLTMSPIILGLSQDAAWSFPWALAVAAPWAAAKFVGTLSLAGLALALVPMLGRVQSLHTFLLGSLALLIAIDLGFPHLTLKADWPGFWFAVGLFVVGGGLAWLGTAFAVILSMLIDPKDEGIGLWLALPASATFGFIPLFIYGAWLGSQIRAG